MHMRVPIAMEADTNVTVLLAMVERITANCVRRKPGEESPFAAFCRVELR